MIKRINNTTFVTTLTGCALVLIILLLWAVNSEAVEYTFSWEPNQEAHLMGYKLCWGYETEVYPNHVDVGKGTLVDERVHAALDIPNKDVYVSAIAYGVKGIESDYSNEVLVPMVTLQAPGQLQQTTINININ